MDTRAKLVTALTCLIVLYFSIQTSHAAYMNVQPKIASALQLDATGQLIYPGAANDLKWAGKAAQINTTLNAGGRLVQIPAEMRMASNAGRYVIKRAIFGGGWPGLALTALMAAPEIIDWLSQNNFSYSNGQLLSLPTLSTPNGSDVDWNSGGWRGSTTGCGANYSCTAQQAAIDMITYQYGSTNTYEPYQIFIRSGFYSARLVIRNKTTGALASANDITRTAPYVAPVTTPTPATETDLDRLGDIPDIIPNTYPMPLPVELPNVQATRVPLGEPRPIPNTNPQEYERPVLDVKPKPTPKNPWGVHGQPGVEKGTNPSPPPDPSSASGATPATPTDTASSVSASASASSNMCDLYPNALACADLGDADKSVLDKKNQDLAINPQGGWGQGGGSCPAPKSFTVLGHTYSFKWDMICDFASKIRPIVIAFAWFSAALLFVGMGRRTS